MFSCSKVPIRIWIMALIFLNWFLTTCIMENLRFCFSMMILRKNQVRYKAWCFMNDEERNAKIENPTLKIVWYNKSSPDYGPRYVWTDRQKTLLNEAQFYGHMVSSVPGGIIAEFLGPYYVLLYTTIMSAVFNVMRVPLAAMDWKVLLASEFVLGLHIGVTFPALFVWIARWAPPNERGIFVATQIGCGLAAALQKVFFRIIVPAVGWRATFYNLSGVTFVYTIVLWFFGANHPEDHKKITSKEIYHIKRLQRGRATSTKSFPPFGNILSSKSFWALNILHFGYTCATRYSLKSVPNYLYYFIGISRRTVDYLEVFPNFGFVTVAIISSLLADYIRVKRIINDTVIAKVYTIFSHFVPGCVLLFIGIAYCNETIAISLLFVGYTATGAAILNCYRTLIDMSPNYSGTIYGLMHVSACFVFILNPKVREYIFTYNDGVIGWTIFFLIGGGSLIGTGVIFLFFGTAKGQWWNLKSQDRFKLYYYKNQQKILQENLEKSDDMDKLEKKTDENQQPKRVSVNSRRNTLDNNKVRQQTINPIAGTSRQLSAEKAVENNFKDITTTPQKNDRKGSLSKTNDVKNGNYKDEKLKQNDVSPKPAAKPQKSNAREVSNRPKQPKRDPKYLNLPTINNNDNKKN